jgi:hypothetical protein
MGLALLLRFFDLEQDISVHCTVFEYEPGWEASVAALAQESLVRVPEQANQ